MASENTKNELDKPSHEICSIYGGGGGGGDDVDTALTMTTMCVGGAISITTGLDPETSVTMATAMGLLSSVSGILYIKRTWVPKAIILSVLVIGGVIANNRRNSGKGNSK